MEFDLGGILDDVWHALPIGIISDRILGNEEQQTGTLSIIAVAVAALILIAVIKK